jgi:homoserine dehydrogenase
LSLTQPAHADRTGHDNHPVGIALLGCGTVGSGVAQLLVGRATGIGTRGTHPVSLVGIAVRSMDKERPAGIPRALFCADAAALVADPRVKIVVECIGGLGVARTLVEQALAAGKHVVTANKDLLATEGPTLRAMAARHGATIAYEAAVGGAIPIVRTLLDALAGERILEVGGVLNGTTNFVLDKMFSGATYGAALAAAQRHGFAEADPTNDVEGIDAAHKLAILAQLAFRRAVTTRDIPRTGISAVTRDDVSLARRLGMTIKLVAVARDGAAIVTPAFVRAGHPFAQPSGPNNCIRVIGGSAGSLTFAGAGAGGAPTASAVIADVIATLRAIGAGSATPDTALQPAGTVARLPLRALIRLHSFRDARPARETLTAAGIEASLLDDVPALLTDAPLRDLAEVAGALRAGGIAADSVLPLWEDAPAPALATNTLTFDSAIAQPA